MNERDIEHAELASSDLRQAAVSGIRWTTVARAVSELINLASAVVLARLIAPSEFGEAVVPMIFVPLAVILTFEGFGSVLVQRQTITQTHIEAAMLASLAMGVVLAAATFLLARPLGGPLFGEETAGLLRLVSPVFVFAGAGVVSRGLLWRRLDFRRISLVEMISLAVGSAAAVGMAIAGLDAEAIVLGAVIGALATTVLLLASVSPPAPRWHHGALREVMGFGLPASAAGLTYVAINNASLAVAAARLSAAQAGLFWRAFQVGITYQGKVSGIMMQLAFPIYSRTSDIDELRRFHERATRIHAVALLPLLSLLIVLAPDVIPWVFGDRWAPAVEAVQILSVAGMIAAVLTGYPQILLAAGRPRALFAFNTALLCLFVVTSWVAAPYGISALALSVVGVHVIIMVAVYGFLFRRLLGIPIGRLLSDLLPAGLCSVVLLVAAIPLADLLRGAGAPVPLIVLLVTAAGALAYGSALRSVFPVVWNDVLQLVAQVLPAVGGRSDRAASQPAKRAKPDPHQRKIAPSEVVTRAMSQRLLVISPVRNEADHFERVGRAVAAQTRPPDLWLVVDDHSNDETHEIAEQLSREFPFVAALQAPEHPPLPDPRDRLACATEARAFNFGLNNAEWRGFTHICKLDGDMELPSEYFERILAEFEADDRLGMAGGLRREMIRGKWQVQRVPTEHHVNGALKCYSRECFEAIGGIQDRLAWDTIDETLARMRGFRTRTFEDLTAIHHRPWASADGTLRGRARYGTVAYITHYPAYWAALRSLKMATARPRGISGLAFFYGYTRAAFQRTPRVEDDEFRQTVHRETRDRIIGKLPRSRRGSRPWATSAVDAH